jgi:hypothetical protein
MNKEDIIRMAREAGFEQAGHLSYQEITYRFISFAFLVASAEREACANTASLALLGADKALSDRVLKAIRARGQA